MRRLRLGVIGAGSWTVSSHLPNLARWRDRGLLEFTIVNRRNPEPLLRIKETFAFREATTDWQDVIAAEPDVVVVASPPGSHWEQSKAALEAGAHVLCEKPFTIDPAHAWDLVETAETAGRELVVAYGWNYRPIAVEALRMATIGGGLGEIEHTAMHMDSFTRELLSGSGGYLLAAADFPPESATWTEPLTSGGGYGQAQLTHLLGLGLWLTGLSGQGVFALMSRPGESPVEIHNAMAVQYDNGSIGTVSGASGARGPLDHRQAVELRVMGSRAMLHVDLRENVLWRRDGDGTEHRASLSLDAGHYDCQGPVDCLVEAALGRRTVNRSPGELGARTVGILDAAYRSADSGRLERVHASPALAATMSAARMARPPSGDSVALE